MPFTLSHVAAVLPLLRQRKVQFSATGLILGSVAPDFEKFLRMGLHNAHSHTWASIFYFSLPVALVLTFLFHMVVRDSLIAHLPRFLQERLAHTRRLDWPRYFQRNYCVVTISIMLGAASHILWDEFTHGGSYAAQHLPVLSVRVGMLPFSPRLFTVFALLSSAIGVLLLGLFVLRLPRLSMGPVPVPALTMYWKIVGLMAFLLLLGRLVLGPLVRDSWDIIISVLSGLIFGVVIASSYYSDNHTGPA